MSNNTLLRELCYLNSSDAHNHTRDREQGFKTQKTEKAQVFIFYFIYYNKFIIFQQ